MPFICFLIMLEEYNHVRGINVMDISEHLKYSLMAQVEDKKICFECILKAI